ncbi:MAG: hypothetical protein ACRDPY_26795 [Streptosporangiaceae bacterium]
MSEAEQPDLAEALRLGFEAMGRVVAAWIEQWRPVFEYLGQPEVRAALEAAVSMPRAHEQPCRCFCGIAHPDDEGICDGEGVTTRRLTSFTFGTVDVPVCAPCAAAEAARKLEAGQ